MPAVYMRCSDPKLDSTHILMQVAQVRLQSGLQHLHTPEFQLHHKSTITNGLLVFGACVLMTVLFELLQTYMFCTFHGIHVSSSSLVPSLCTPPSEKWSGEQSRIFSAYYPKVVKTNEIAFYLLYK